MRKLALAVVLLSLSSAQAFGVIFFEHGEIASKNAIITDVRVVKYNIGGAWEFPAFSLDCDYVIPVFAPFSIGFYVVIPKLDDMNLKSFGFRVGYHFDINVDNLDLYIFYNFDLGFTRNKALRENGDVEQPIHYYDFRGGVRYLFGRLVGLYIETGYKAVSIDIGLTFKIN